MNKLAKGASHELQDALGTLVDSKYPMAVKAWRTRWGNMTPFFGCPGPICKMLNTTIAVALAADCWF